LDLRERELGEWTQTWKGREQGKGREGKVQKNREEDGIRGRGRKIMAGGK